jgi:hypothetical protein
MSDIDSKKDNGKKLGDYGEKLGNYGKNLVSSILKFCILILIGCLILYASKACGSGILDVIIPTLYIEGLTDTILFKPIQCSDDTNGKEDNAQFLNTQYINHIKGNDNQSLYQELNFLYNSENKEDVWSSLTENLNIIREQMQNKTIGDKNPTKKKISFFELFITGIISNVSIFNLTFLNSYLKFLNNNFSDSATIIFGPFISIIISLIISIMSIFVTAYYVVYNVQWLVLNNAADKYDPSELKISTWNSQIFIKGVPIFYTPSKNLLLFPWLGWICWCIMIGYVIAITIFPISIGLTVYNLLKWLFFILFLPSTRNNTDEPCNFFTMFVDSFKYKRPLISWIMSLIVISTSFDVFDTAGGSVAIIVFLLVYFNFIKIGLFDKYVPTDVEASTFVQMNKVKDLLPKCVTKYEDAQPTQTDNVDDTMNAVNDDTMNAVNDDTMATADDTMATAIDEVKSNMIPFNTSLAATKNAASSIASSIASNVASNVASNAITAVRSTPSGAAATKAISIASNISPDASLAAQSAIDKVVPINNISSTLQKISKNKQ